ncbi:MAG TPA: L-threonylcarbamoyladenylate synthase [Paludibacter sp.]|nr:L-threonylcarbamoyladenylate synthase [Paludibacter sp.]
MKIITEESLEEAAKCLQEGGLVAFPTETVYGLGANALDPLAVAKIFEAKERPAFDPLIVHIASLGQLDELLAQPVNPLVFELAAKFWPGPLTLVQPKSAIVPALVTSDLDSVAVRMPSHPVALRLLQLAGIPVAAPSANKFGQLSPTSYKHVVKQNMPVDYVVAGDILDKVVGIESTVVSIDKDVCTILRPGVITSDDLKRAIPGLVVQVPGENIKLASPGLLKSHYSPLKPLYFRDKSRHVLPAGSGLIVHSAESGKFNAEKVICTSKDHNLLEIAANLFASLHSMEEDPDVKQIFIERIEEKGIGIAIMDRLKKATFQYKADPQI